MGVPAFFRWLTRKYSSVVVHCNEQKTETVNGVTIPIDSSQPNPNNVEFDNLYLDMNGIIHPCTHPEDKPAPKDEDEMMIAIFECIDRLFNIVRPRKLLYMAIDGVAPRAKMNQQRSRRFRASKETMEKIKEIENRRKELLDKGAYLPPEKPKESHFDSNCITPGTPFMARLSACLHYYIHDRLNNDPGWKNIKKNPKLATARFNPTYMAIDGVAPRAKMNQQRSRRFRASKETMEKIKEIENRRKELLDKGAYLPPEKPKESHFDSNCITPGTPFMARLSACLHYYIHDRLNNDPGWKNIKVILSDANVPGEGEHKIMDYIRKQRSQPDHDPNTQHVLCGADADLIMLGLATHEPNFTIIREEFRPNKPRPCDLCSQVGHEMKDCVGCPKPAGGEVEVPAFGDEVPFIFVRLSILREYLKKELDMPGLPFKYDFERAVDDWVFMCFFVGNDFLPHLPSLEIREGAIDRLVSLYKNCVYKTGGFVTDSGNVNLSRVQLILNELGKVEDEIFKKRQQTELMFKQREKNRKRFASTGRDGRPTHQLGGQFAPSPLMGQAPPSITNPRQEAYQGRVQGMHSRSNSDTPLFQHGKRKFDEPEAEEEDETPDEVRLWEDGFKDRYYESKFDVSAENMEYRIRVGHEYVRGLCWVLRYYYQGCASWKWYFPYHYAPFASDFLNIGDLSTEFEKNTKPFQPLQQLMGVFPAASSSHVPKPWAELMHNPFSPIIDFYPIDFKIDLNGKKFAWQGVALLPFVDENRMFKALAPYYDALTPAEKKRNIKGDDRLYIGPGNKAFDFLKGLYDQTGPDHDEEIDLANEGMQGKILLTADCVSMDGQLLSPVRGLSHICDNRVICVRFRDPKYSDDFIFPAKRLKGAQDPPNVLKPGDLGHEQNRNWRPQIGMAPSNQRAYLSGAGHRTVDHYNRSSMAHNRSLSDTPIYSAVPPPSALPLMAAQREMPRPYHPGMQAPTRPRGGSGYGYTSTNSQNSRSVGTYYGQSQSGGYQSQGYQSQGGYRRQDQGGYQSPSRGGGGGYQSRGGYQRSDQQGGGGRNYNQQNWDNRNDNRHRSSSSSGYQGGGGGYRR